MKCLILAGGRGERLWPLSRNNYPKQFIQVQKNHSIFQETVARNLSYCDEFIIVTNYSYRSIVSNQMEAFQGVPYRCVFEEEPRGTTAAIALTCLQLQPSEFVFVVSADLLIDTGACSGLSYKDSILRAKEFAQKGNIVIFGKRTDEISDRFGYFTEGGREFFEKPDRKCRKELQNQISYRNLGMMLFQNGTLLNELKRLKPDVFMQCHNSQASIVPEGLIFRSDVLRTIEAVPIERSVIEKTDLRIGLAIDYGWSDVASLEDLENTDFESEGLAVVNDGVGTTIINQSKEQAVVVNDLDNVIVVNTSDAIYIGRKGKSHLLKEILHDNDGLESFADHGTMYYRSWGYYEQLTEEVNFGVKKVVILPGKTILEHSHSQRSENWAIVQGKARVTIGGEVSEHGENDLVCVKPGLTHQITNVGDDHLIIIETAIGKDFSSRDIAYVEAKGVSESDLGLQIDPIVKLSPAFKDYLWGGTKLRDVFHKQCDFTPLAESWELSAHPDGSSIVASGRHKGLPFGKYLQTVGKKVLGWKSASLQEFPLLVKFIDAEQNLSVQVHPNDEYALENENEYGKNEMWYVIDSKPGSGLYIGFNRDVNRNEIEDRLKNDTILEVLNFFPTKPGDVFFIPAGTVHAIGAGNLICEIQQSSNVTYRLYDYNRKDKFGNTRELHVRKALDVLNYVKYEPVDFVVEQLEGRKQIRCKYFDTLIVEGETKLQLLDESFFSAVCVNGSGELEISGGVMKMTAGDTVFIPAVNGTLNFRGNASCLLVRV